MPITMSTAAACIFLTSMVAAFGQDSPNAASAPRVFEVSDHGAVGDGHTDDGPAIWRAVQAVRHYDGPAVLAFGKGRRYRVASLPVDAPTAHLFTLSDDHDIEIDGRGCTFVLRFPLHFISIAHSERVTFHDFTFTYDPLTFTQGHVAAVHPEMGALDVQLLDGFDLPAFDPAETDFNGAWHFCWTFNPACHVFTKTIKAIDEAHTARRVFRVFVQDGVVGALGRFKPGETRIVVPTLGVVDGVPQRSGTHSWISGSRDITLRDITQHAAPDFSFCLWGNLGRILVHNVDIRPPEGSGRWIASWRDGFHVKQNRGPIIIEDSYLEGLLDDCVNVSQISLTVEDVAADNRYRIRVVNRESFPTIEPGFTLEGWNRVSGKYCGKRTITKVEPGPAPGYWNTLVTVDRPLDHLVADGDTVRLWINECANPGTIIRNNQFHGSVRFRSAGRFENNLVESFMIIKPDGAEGPIAHDMVFRGNLLPASGIRTIFAVMRNEGVTALPPHDHAAPADRMVHDILFEGNTIGRPIYLFDARDVTFRDNTFTGDGGVVLRNSGPVHVEGSPARVVKELGGNNEVILTPKGNE